MGILNSPAEVLLSVADGLPIEDLSNLLSACRQLAFPLTPRLYSCLMQNSEGPSPLQWAAERGHASLAEMAISRGAEIDEVGVFGRTPLHLAAYYNHSDVVRTLLRHGASASAKDDSSMTPLELAASLEAVEATAALLEIDPGTSDWMVTPAFAAATRGNLGCMRAFVDAGFDLRTINFCGQTVLHVALSGWGMNLEMLKYLLSQESGKAAINFGDQRQPAPLYLAAHRFGAEHIRVLLQNGADMAADYEHGFKPAHVAAAAGNVEALAVFIEGGFDLNIKTRSGGTIFHAAVDGNRLGALEYLLGQEAAQVMICARTSDGRTPLHLVVDQSHGPEMIRLLLRHGADMMARDRFGDTPAHIAAFEGDVECLRAFIDNGFDVNTRGRRGRTILHHAAICPRVDATRYLLRACFAPLPTTRDGRWSPPRPPVVQNFRKAQGGSELSEEAQRRGGEISIIDAKDCRGSTPLHLAAKADDRIMMLLVRYGADTTIKDRNGNTPAQVLALGTGEGDGPYK